MINSRDLGTLREDFATRARNFVQEYERRFLCELLITCTLRDKEAQEKLYAIGRIVAGRIITNAKPGDSFHNYGLAFDAVPLIHGKPLWEVYDHNHLMVPEWRNYGGLAKEFNFQWAGDWTSFREYAHMQDAGFTLTQLKQGA